MRILPLEQQKRAYFRCVIAMKLSITCMRGTGTIHANNAVVHSSSEKRHHRVVL